MSCRVDTTSMIAGACVVSAYDGFGILGQNIPSTGANGHASPLFNDNWVAGKEYRWVPTPPSVGTAIFYEDGSFYYLGPSTSISYEGYEDNLLYGTTASSVVAGSSISGGAIMGGVQVSGALLVNPTAGLAIIGNTNVFGANMKKNTAGQKVGVQMTFLDGSDFVGTVFVYLTGDGGAQAIGSVSAGACVHKGNGYHVYSPAQAESNYNHIGFTFKGAGAATVTKEIYTSFPQTADAPTSTQIADATLNRDMAAVADTNTRSILNALRFIRNKWTNTGATLTVFKEDDVTPAWTAVIASTPGADPVSGVDPV